jgi:phosphoglycolate phosphatase-like HAD superfamily hydrolase
MTRACLDFNGVLADPKQALIDILKRDFGIRVSREGFGKHLIGSSFPNVIRGGRPKLLTQSMWEAAKDMLFDTNEFLAIPPIEGAISALCALRGAGWEIRIVTDARTVTRERMETWLKKHGFDGHVDIIFSRKRGSKEPYQSCCDIVVDNELEQLLPLVGKMGPKLIHFLPIKDEGISSLDGNILSLKGWPEIVGSLLGPDIELAA